MHMEESSGDLRALRARSSALTVSGLVVAVGIASLLSWRALPDPALRATQIGGIIVGLFIFAWVRQARTVPSVATSAAAYVIAVLPLIGYAWLVDSVQATRAQYWV